MARAHELGDRRGARREPAESRPGRRVDRRDRQVHVRPHQVPRRRSTPTPPGVTRLFAQGGTSDNDATSQFVSAGDRAVAGTYARQRDAGRGAGAATSASPARGRRRRCPTVKVRVGTTEVSYAVQDGDTRADVVNGLNAAFASAGLALQATDTGSGVQIATDQYGIDREVRRRLGRQRLRHRTPARTCRERSTASPRPAAASNSWRPFDDPTISGLAISINRASTRRLRELHLLAGPRPARARRRSRTRPTSSPGTSRRRRTTTRRASSSSTTRSRRWRLHVTAYETHLRQQYADAREPRSRR